MKREFYIVIHLIPKRCQILSIFKIIRVDAINVKPRAGFGPATYGSFGKTAAYETVALPLSYRGTLQNIEDVGLFLRGLVTKN
jgi:hypothetical protein